MSDKLSEATLTLLQSCSAATLTTALFKRGFRNTWINGVDRLTNAGGPMVGPAYALRYMPAREDLDHIGVFEDRQHPQRKAVEDIPAGCVLVMDCRGDWMPIVLAAVLVFLVSSVIHMLLSYHQSDYAAVPQEDDVMERARGGRATAYGGGRRRPASGWRTRGVAPRLGQRAKHVHNAPHGFGVERLRQPGRRAVVHGLRIHHGSQRRLLQVRQLRRYQRV